MPLSGRFVVQYSGVLLVVGLLCLLGIIGANVWLGERARIYAADASDARELRVAAVEVRNAMQTAESAERGFLLSGNEIYLAPYDSAKVLLARHLGRLKASMASLTDKQAMMQRLIALCGEKVAEMDRTIALKQERRDADALSIVQSNRGKAMMDEANVFLSSVVRIADERLNQGMSEQQNNALMLRWVSAVGGAIIVLVVSGVAALGFRYASEIAMARDQVRDMNVSLERRVTERTTALAEARDRAEVLLSEVNHRVANSLMMVASMVRLQSNALQSQEAKRALAETEARIHAISDVHKRLYNSGDARLVALDEYLADLLANLRRSMHDEGHGASLNYELDPLKMPTDSSVNLGVVMTEWVTNAFKYAYPQQRGEVRVNLRRLEDGRAQLRVEDDGIGRDDNAPARGTGLGTRLVKAMAASLRGEIDYVRRHPGTLASLTFPLPAVQ